MPFGYRNTFGDEGLGSISACVTNLPAGYTLGERRVEGGIEYKLVYNAADSQIIPGLVASPVPLSGGPYSVTVTTVTGLGNEAGMVVCHNATAPAATYFWGVTRGYLASGLIATGTCLVTGFAIQVAAGGSVTGVSTNAVSSYAKSGGVAIGQVFNGPLAGTVAVRQGSVFVNVLFG